MKKMTIIYFIILSFITFFLSIKAECFDSESISQVSKGITEWKLMNEDTSETKVEQKIYVPSSLGEIGEGGNGEEVGVVKGLAAFDNNDYWNSSEIKNWELNAGIEASNKYISTLPTNPMVDIGDYFTEKGIRTTYDLFTQNRFDVVNIFRNYQGKPALAEFPRSWKIASGTYEIASSAMGAAITFSQTIDYIGTSMQIMNPPIYLKNNSGAGQFVSLSDTQKIIGVPISGTWKGDGSYTTDHGVVNYQEILNTSGSEITQTHINRGTTDFGTFYQQVEIKTPVANGFERFAITQYPLGSYFDPKSYTITTTTRVQQSYRIETLGGISKITTLPTSGIGQSYSGASIKWNDSSPTFDATWKTVKMDSTIINYPSIKWTSLSKTNWNIPSYNTITNKTYSMPKMTSYPNPNILFSTKSPISTYTSPTYKIPSYTTTYTPTIPYSSWGVK